MIPPYGGTLVNLLVDDARANEMKATAKDYASITLDECGLCDLELLAVGGFSPLTGFLGQNDFERVIAESRLADGTVWPVPITLPVIPGNGVEVGKPLALRDVYGNLLGFLHVEEIYSYNDGSNESVGHYAAGRLEVIRVPPHYDFVELRRTPAELRETFNSLGWTKIVAFHTSTPLHRADEELTKRTAEQVGAGLLIHPAVGVIKPGDIAHYTRIRCYRALVDNYYEKGSVLLSLLPLASRPAGPHEALLHAIIRRNYGCTHFIVDSQNAEALKQYQSEIGIEIVESKPMVYLPSEDRYSPVDEVPANVKTESLSDTQVQENYLAKGIPLPAWFSRPAVAAILNETSPPKHRQGLTLWFTGLSGSGKSTVAHGLIERLAEYGRNVSFLDGDEIRTHLAKGLSFSKEDRDTNINRVGYVAGLVNAAGGTTVCSVISPYRGPRDNARKASKGNFVEIFCDTPIDTCEKRDVKGLYAKARSAVAEGKGMGFTGVDDPYEAPLNPEVTIDTSVLNVQQSVDVIIAKLLELGYILP